MLAGTGVRGAPPKTEAVAVGTGPTSKPPVGRAPGRVGTSGSTITGAAMDAVEALGNRGVPQPVEEGSEFILGFWRTGWHNPHSSNWDLLKGVLHDGDQSEVRQVIMPHGHDTLVCHHPPDGHAEL